MVDVRKQLNSHQPCFCLWPKELHVACPARLCDSVCLCVLCEHEMVNYKKENRAAQRCNSGEEPQRSESNVDTENKQLFHNMNHMYSAQNTSIYRLFQMVKLLTLSNNDQQTTTSVTEVTDCWKNFSTGLCFGGKKSMLWSFVNRR